MKKLLPLVVALLGLGAGVGAGVAFKPAPEPETEAAVCVESAAPEPAAPAAEPCPPAADDPFAKVAADAPKPEGKFAYVPIDKPFVVPVFRGDQVAAMVVMSLSVAVAPEAEEAVKSVQPRLRDSFLKVMFQHANSGGFDGSFTTGQKMRDLHAALLNAARETVPHSPVAEVLITEIARQDV